MAKSWVTFRDVLLHLTPEIIEDTNEVAKGSATINSRSFHGLSAGSETIFACAAFHSLKSSFTSALLPRLSQKAAASPGLWNQRGCSLVAF